MRVLIVKLCALIISGEHMTTITVTELFKYLAEISEQLTKHQQAAATKRYYPHAAKGALDGLHSLLNGQGITQSDAHDLLVICGEVFDTMSMQDIEEWLETYHGYNKG